MAERDRRRGSVTREREMSEGDKDGAELYRQDAAKIAERLRDSLIHKMFAPEDHVACIGPDVVSNAKFRFKPGEDPQ